MITFKKDILCSVNYIVYGLEYCIFCGKFILDCTANEIHSFFYDETDEHIHHYTIMYIVALNFFFCHVLVLELSAILSGYLRLPLVTVRSVTAGALQYFTTHDSLPADGYSIDVPVAQINSVIQLYV